MEKSTNTWYNNDSDIASSSIRKNTGFESQTKNVHKSPKGASLLVQFAFLYN